VYTQIGGVVVVGVWVEGVHNLSLGKSGDAIGVLVTPEVSIRMTTILEHKAVTHRDLDMTANCPILQFDTRLHFFYH